MLVSYTYRSDEPALDDNEGSLKPPGSALAKTVLETKTFSFYTIVDLGVIVPKEDVSGKDG